MFWLAQLHFQQLDESGLIFTGVVITNTVNTVDTDTLSSAQFDALLTNSAIDSIKSQSSNEISLSMKSHYNSDISQLTGSNSIINLPPSSAAVVGIVDKMSET
jgi:hypothetical protein